MNTKGPSLESALPNLDEIFMEVDDLDGLNTYFEEARVPLELVAPPAVNVQLLDLSYDAAKVVALATRGYGGTYTPQISRDEIDHNLEELRKTKLKTPLRFANSVWLLNNVTRSFTHQMVRYDIGTAFVQESLRFAVHERVRVLVPRRALERPEHLRHYAIGAAEAVTNYHRMLQDGAPAEDARGLLPSNVLTSIFCSLNLSTVAHIYEQRMCCQAQAEEWITVATEFKRQLEAQQPELAGFITAPWECGQVNCGFNAKFDRPCAYADKFKRNLNDFLAEHAPA